MRITTRIYIKTQINIWSNSTKSMKRLQISNISLEKLKLKDRIYLRFNKKFFVIRNW